MPKADITNGANVLLHSIIKISGFGDRAVKMPGAPAGGLKNNEAWNIMGTP
jgi:hypothetical protein